MLASKVPSRIGYHRVSDPVEQRALLVRLSVYKKALAVSVPHALEYSDGSCPMLTAFSIKLAKVRALSATLASMDTDLIAARQEALEAQEALAKWEVCPLCQQPIGEITRMLKGIAIGDVHLCEKNPICRKDDVRVTQLTKLRQVIDLCNKHQCPLYIAGDLYDAWDIGFKLVNEVN